MENFEQKMSKIIPGMVELHIIKRIGTEIPLEHETKNEYTKEKIRLFDIGEAKIRWENGEPLARYGWNGKNMFTLLQDGEYLGSDIWGNMCYEPPLKGNQYFIIKQPDGTVSTWAPSVGDILGNDWYVVTCEFEYDGNFKYSDGDYYIPKWASSLDKNGKFIFRDGGRLFIKNMFGFDVEVSIGDTICYDGYNIWVKNKR